MRPPGRVVPSTLETMEMLRATSRSRRLQVGFSLVELMVAIAVVGILASISVSAVREHLNHSKSAEALSALGAIGRAVHMAYERDRTSSALLALGDTSSLDAAKTVGSTSGKGKGKGKGSGATVTFGVPGLCGDAEPVPSAFGDVTGKKYQAHVGGGQDYDSGDGLSGWRCLRFTMETPQSYQYSYKVGGPPVDVELPHGGSPKGLSADHTWTATARGDVDGDGEVSWFVLEGAINDAGQVMTAPAISTIDPNE